jgi:hypothetical protein
MSILQAGLSEQVDFSDIASDFTSGAARFKSRDTDFLQEEVLFLLMLHAAFLLGLFFDPPDESDMILPKLPLTSTGLCGVISHKTELFITTAVRTSDPAFTYQFGPTQSSILLTYTS